MEVEENVPLILGSNASKQLSVLGKSSRGSRFIRRVGVGAKGILGLQGNASDGDENGKVAVRLSAILNYFDLSFLHCNSSYMRLFICL